jgi:hypothetical protein
MPTDEITEKEFIDSIDCRFPYKDASSALALIEQGCAISGNAAFGVVYELARVPKSKHASQKVLLALLDHLDRRLQHPLKDMVFPVVRSIIRKHRIPDAEAVRLMENIRNNPGEYNALAIVYFAAEDCGEAVETAYQDIQKAWMT